MPPEKAAARGGVPRLPAAIAGFPTQVEVHDLGMASVGLVAVRDLERHLDRERLLLDDGYPPPYWALVWSGARVLARHLAERIDCAGKRVLDVGCGLGLTTIAAAQKGGRVTAIDRELPAIEFLLASAAANGVRVEALVGDVTATAFDREFDLVLAAELLYEAAEFARLADALAAAVAPSGVVWLADAHRVDTRPFFAALARHGFEIAEVCSCEVREETTVVRIRLVRLGRRAARPEP